jgi:hypothetical protein
VLLMMSAHARGHDRGSTAARQNSCAPEHRLLLLLLLLLPLLLLC